MTKEKYTEINKLRKEREGHLIEMIRIDKKIKEIENDLIDNTAYPLNDRWNAFLQAKRIDRRSIEYHDVDDFFKDNEAKYMNDLIKKEIQLSCGRIKDCLDRDYDLGIITQYTRWVILTTLMTKRIDRIW